MDNSSQAERRKFPRFDFSIPLHLSFIGSDLEEVLLRATSINISLNGVYCTVNKYLSLFEKILIMFVNPPHNGNPPEIIFQCESVVVRIEPEQEETGRKNYRVALYFPNLSPQHENTLQELIDTHIIIS